ncbi:hypothetical protein HDU85_007281 [Gaertneriomyces sp. JEL0708]|nr:hypothetical protein HDU85_007281 [Gaertneriomyces sp. JEL0708]
MPAGRRSIDEHEPLLRVATRAKEITKSNWDDFKEFIDRGKAIDLAVGVIIGAAFSSIVNSLVEDIFSPLLSLAGQHQLGAQFIILRPPDLSSDLCKKNPEFCVHPKTPKQAHEVGAITFNYGHFIEKILNFFIVAFMLFFVIKAYTKVLHKSSKFLKRKRDCPYCTEEIPAKASRCRYCCKDVVPDILHGSNDHAELPQSVGVNVQ